MGQSALFASTPASMILFESRVKRASAPSQYRPEGARMRKAAIAFALATCCLPTPVAVAAPAQRVEFGGTLGRNYAPKMPTTVPGGDVVFAPRPSSSFSAHPLVSDDALWPVA